MRTRVSHFNFGERVHMAEVFNFAGYPAGLCVKVNGEWQDVQVDSSGNPIFVLGNGPNTIGTVIVEKSSTVVLNQPSTAQTASGNSANLSVQQLSELAVDVNVTAVAGTSPTLNLYIDRLGADGVWYNIWSGTQITAISVQSTSIGAGCITNQSFGSTIRFRWVLGGTTPSFTFSASIVGK